MHEAVFIRLLDIPVDEKDAALRSAVHDVHAGSDGPVFRASKDLLSRFPQSAWVYDLPPSLAEMFRTGSPVREVFFEAQRGLGASNADHLFRLWWEVDPSDIGMDQRWTRSNNGSPYSPYFFPSLWVARSDGGSWVSVRSYATGAITGAEFYGRAGLGYGKRTDYMYAYPLPAGHVFTVEGQALYPVDGVSPQLALAVANSRIYAAMANRFTAQHKYHGYLNDLNLRAFQPPGVERDVDLILNGLLSLDTANEISARFVAPLGLSQSVAAARDFTNEINLQTADARRRIDRAIEEALGVNLSDSEDPPYDIDYVETCFGASNDSFGATHAADLLQWCVGVCFGRWDPISAVERRPRRAVPALLGALPNVPPGGLLDGERSARPPLAGDGLLVEQEGHPRDIVAAVREVLAYAFGSQAEEKEEEVLRALRGDGNAPRTLREWFTGVRAGQLGKTFFDWHIQRYSRSRRKAPIYWRVTSTGAAQAGWGCWLYYPRLQGETIWRLVGEYLRPRRDRAERRVADLERELTQLAGRERRRAEGELETERELLEELSWLEERFTAILQRGYEVDRDDGVVVNIAPLHEVVPWSEAAEVWEELEAGEYDWARMARRFWPERVEKKARSDRSIAIAHGLA